MIETPVVFAEDRSSQFQHRPLTPARTPLRHHLAVSAILQLSVFVTFYILGQHDFRNGCYATGVRSMLDAVHTFFFVSYDPVGFVGLDDPPFGFWLLTLCAR